jgi:outer membrane immunogenic protein
MTVGMRSTACAAAVILLSSVTVEAADGPARRVTKSFKVAPPKPAMIKPRLLEDLPLPPPPPIPVEFAPPWSGGYAGLSFGARWSNAEWSTTSLGGAAATTSDNPRDFDTTAFRAGAYAGHNWQLSPLTLIGLEADFGWAGRSTTVGGIPGTYASGGAAGAVSNDNASVKLGWDASMRGRFGVLFTSTWLIYATGGLAVQRIELGGNCIPAGGFCTMPRSESERINRLGWTAGGGVEGLFWGGWMARLEYRYADFGTPDHTFFLNTGDQTTLETRVRTHTGLAGVAYKFGWSEMPAAPPVRTRF